MSQSPVVGILGGGQLGRMSAFAARRMGLQVRFLIPEPSPPVEHLGEVVVADWHDPRVLRAFAEGCDVVTTESEWAPLDLLAEHAPSHVAVWPSPRTLRLIRHKGIQKQHLKEAGLPVPDFTWAHTREEALEAATHYGFPVLFKRFQRSYDGYGNATVHNEEEAREAWNRLADEDGLLVERFVPFRRELATLVARTPSGDEVTYPTVWTEQRDHRCYAVMAPAAIDTRSEQYIRTLADRTMQAFEGVGLLAIELFELEDGSLLINELAPRPHNTAHYTIEACYTSQFENHIRAVLDWPLGVPDLKVPAATMVNLLGHRTGTATPQGIPRALAVPRVSLHIYDKRRVTPGRKMGHVTACGDSIEETRRLAEQAASAIQF